MRKFYAVLIFGWFVHQAVFAQEEGTVAMDIISLQMPPELSTLFLTKISEGGQVAATAIERLPDLAQTKKILLLDRWKIETKSSQANKRSISVGRDISLDNGEKLASGIQLTIEPSIISGTELISARWELRSELAIKGDRDNYSLHQKITTLAVKNDEWITLGSWMKDQQMLMILGKFQIKDAPVETKPPRDRLLQSSIEYSLYLLPNTPSAGTSNKQLSGISASEFLKTGTLLETGSSTWNLDAQFIAVDDKTVSLKDPSSENLPGFLLEACISISSDQKTAEMGLITTWTPKRGEAKMATVSYNNWLELPVGELTLVPLEAQNSSGKSALYLALEIKTKVLQPNAIQNPKRAQAEYQVPANARRKLALAAGLEVSKPESNHGSFEILPKVSDSLEKLGLIIPDGVHLIHNMEQSKIFLYGKDAPHAELEKLLGEHLSAKQGKP